MGPRSNASGAMSYHCRDCVEAVDEVEIHAAEADVEQGGGLFAPAAAGVEDVFHAAMFGIGDGAVLPGRLATRSAPFARVGGAGRAFLSAAGAEVFGGRDGFGGAEAEADEFVEAVEGVALFAVWLVSPTSSCIFSYCSVEKPNSAISSFVLRRTWMTLPSASVSAMGKRWTRNPRKQPAYLSPWQWHDSGDGVETVVGVDVAGSGGGGVEEQGFAVFGDVGENEHVAVEVEQASGNQVSAVDGDGNGVGEHRLSRSRVRRGNCRCTVRMTASEKKAYASA